MKNTRALKLSPIYLSYIDYMQNPDGTFKNILSFKRNFLDEVAIINIVLQSKGTQCDS